MLKALVSAVQLLVHDVPFEEDPKHDEGQEAEDAEGDEVAGSEETAEVDLAMYIHEILRHRKASETFLHHLEGDVVAPVDTRRAYLSVAVERAHRTSQVCLPHDMQHASTGHFIAEPVAAFFHHAHLFRYPGRVRPLLGQLAERVDSSLDPLPLTHRTGGSSSQRQREPSPAPPMDASGVDGVLDFPVTEKVGQVRKALLRASVENESV
mmetsp:Transcript_47443/g.148407  ORF Transcript_47443/g.148407 Transcript_47443/m.148407 type:complete len:209 (+) Transcript_47443:49-675(+)